MPRLHVYSNLGLHLCFTFIISFFDNIAPKSLTVTWLTLFINFQKSTSPASGELAQLKEDMAASKAEFEKKVKDLEAALAKTTTENAELRQTLEKQEENWKTRLTTTEQKPGESQGILQNLTNRIGAMVKAIWGTCLLKPLYKSIYPCMINILCLQPCSLFCHRYKTSNCDARRGNTTPPYPVFDPTTLLWSWAGHL